MKLCTLGFFIDKGKCKYSAPHIYCFNETIKKALHMKITFFKNLKFNFLSVETFLSIQNFSLIVLLSIENTRVNC